MSTETAPAHPGTAEWLAAAHRLVLLLDWFACCVGGMREPVVARVLAREHAWSPAGQAHKLHMARNRLHSAFSALQRKYA